MENQIVPIINITILLKYKGIVDTWLNIPTFLRKVICPFGGKGNCFICSSIFMDLPVDRCPCKWYGDETVKDVLRIAIELSGKEK